MAWLLYICTKALTKYFFYHGYQNKKNFLNLRNHQLIRLVINNAGMQISQGITYEHEIVPIIINLVYITQFGFFLISVHLD